MGKEFSDDPIRPEHFGMILLRFLKKFDGEFFNISEIKQKASEKTLEHNRVKEKIIFFIHQGFVEEFDQLKDEEKKQYFKKNFREIRSESYRITTKGADKYTTIKNTCLDPMTDKLL